MEWLRRGFAQVNVQSPLYDRARVTVEVLANDNKYSAQLSSEKRRCAVAEMELPADLPSTPAYQGHRLINESYDPPVASRENMEALKQSGCPAKAFLWFSEREMATYLRDQRIMPAVLRTDSAPNSQGYANSAFLLGCANCHFAAVASMSPWIHLETKSQNYQAVALGTGLISEMTIVSLFNKKGHECADCVFELFAEDSKACVCSIRQRAIYRCGKLDGIGSKIGSPRP